MRTRPAATEERFKPAVPRCVVRALSGAVWCGVGVLLLVRALAWDRALAPGPALSLLLGGLVGAAAFWRLLFARVTGRNLGRLAGLPERVCVFAVQSWKGWLMVGGMILFGLALRRSPLPRAWLVGPWLAMGLALLRGGVELLAGGSSGRPGGGPPP